MKYVCSNCGEIKYMYMSHVKKLSNEYICKVCLGKQKRGIPKQKYDKSLQRLLTHYRKKFDFLEVK